MAHKMLSDITLRNLYEERKTQNDKEKKNPKNMLKDFFPSENKNIFLSPTFES